MSMLSAQCDELRSMAESVGLAMPQAATLMMEAADTILSLRDRAQDMQVENAKLRELVRDVHSAIGELCAQQDCDACKLRDEGACERGVLTARACVLGVEVDDGTE